MSTLRITDSCMFALDCLKAFAPAIGEHAQGFMHMEMVTEIQNEIPGGLGMNVYINALFANGKRIDASCDIVKRGDRWNLGHMAIELLDAKGCRKKVRVRYELSCKRLKDERISLTSRLYPGVEVEELVAVSTAYRAQTLGTWASPLSLDEVLCLCNSWANLSFHQRKHMIEEAWPASRGVSWADSLASVRFCELKEPKHCVQRLDDEEMQALVRIVMTGKHEKYR